ncbi:MAG: hypothetical protein SFZ03_08230 [Candidatus Melainabacteria bacterium]|nr:hypothetical protein [Candidatus Melainabacteria bacterium]
MTPLCATMLFLAKHQTTTPTPYLARAQRLFKTSESALLCDLYGQDYVWALCSDNIIRELRHKLKQGKILSFRELEAQARAHYRQIKLENETRLHKQFLNTLNPTDLALYQYLSQHGFDKAACQPEAVEALLNQTGPNITPSRFMEESFFRSDDLGPIIGKMLEARSAFGLDPFGVEAFGIPRTETDGYEKIVCQVNRDTGTSRWQGNAVGKMFESSLSMLDREALQTVWQPVTAPQELLQVPELANYLAHFEQLQLAVWKKQSPLLQLPQPLMTVYALKLPHKTAAAVWMASSPQNIPPVFRHLEQCFFKHQLLCALPWIARRNKVAVIRNIANIQWHYHQLMPYRRGSAMIGEIIGRALLESAQIEPGALRKDKTFDLPAFCSPLEWYQQHYTELFESPP